ncbi:MULTISPECIES: hypothetical protein [Vibrio]|uniref:hypothetical protein n=1 Tax=Vibrio TaxID=662 RepID=UPI000346FBA5|nr:MULTISPECIES: hypothetical protein [Vibrio]EWS70711.1 hypothetical protein Y702_01255 [Vibrio vulnificus BAA87]MCA0764639.1 hypothetical protein [Vibrio vulnificus]MDV2306378.1 hypothetical protein [Vibrio cholerae]NHE85629.1 hypothetical protein [Vibrio vulnificus]POC53556.1 hypothetical protein CRN45_05520 [Vibrio vulnificus]
MKAPERLLGHLKVHDLFEFMGVKHPVYMDQESKAELIYAKGLVDQIGIDWKNQRVKMNEGDNPVLYSVATYKSTVNLEGVDTSPNAHQEATPSELSVPKQPVHEMLKPKEGLYIAIDRVHFYLSRLSSAGIRVRGNEDSADYIFKLQLEWADALYKYETNGIAIKQSLQKQEKERVDLLTKLQKLKKDSQDPKIRAIADYHLDQILNELGLPVEEKKQA